MLKRNSNQFQRELRKIIDLSGERVDIGHFEEQGKHTTLGIGLSDLMELHHNGLALNQKTGAVFDIPPRSPLNILANRKGRHLPMISKRIMDWGRTKMNKSSTADLLAGIGNDMAVEEAKLFNHPPLTANSPVTIKIKDSNIPLVDSGELRSSIRYKTSLRKALRKGK